MCRLSALLLLCWPGLLFCQQSADLNPRQPGELAGAGDQGAPAESKRLFGIIPNFRTSASLVHYKPLSTREKFKVATQDSFDRGTVILAAAFAGESQLTNANRDFGQGVAGYGRYFATSYADFVTGDLMTEAIFPSILHQDPRYFRDGKGSGWSRARYAIGQTLITHGDDGSRQPNFSELLGNSASVAIGMSYYENNRTASDAVTRLASQVGVDMVSNLLKEFSSDILRKPSHKQN